MKNKYTTLTAVALSLALSAAAVPAKRGLHIVTQPDGTTLTIQKVGDERMHFTLTADDKLLTLDADGQFCYAKIDASGELQSTGVKAVDAAVRPMSHKTYMQSFADVNTAKLTAKRAARAPQKAIAQTGMGTFTSNFPKSGDIKGLILLVEYSDVKFQTSYETSAQQYFSDMINKEGFNEFGGTGSATDYFKYCSYGNFNPHFDVVGPITLSKKRSYYGGNDSYGNDLRPAQMIKEACELANAQINFADYDNDGDGECDNVYVIYAGVGEASSYTVSESIWPHAWQISYGIGSTFSLDGVVIDRYACSNEWMGSKPDGIGTFVHEFSHVMGLPDLYNTSSTAYYTPGSYSVMDYGPYNNDSRTPPAYSIFERNAMGWSEPTVLDCPATISLEHIATSNQGCIIQTTRPKEFFLLENRQQSGWDKYIPNHGMIIWHIDFNQTVWDNNSVNNTQSHQYVDIVEANNNSNGTTETVLKGWTWPGTSGKTEFTATTTPALKDWNGNAIDVPITDITEKDGIITFNVCGGCTVDIPTPKAEDELEKGSNYFVAAWDDVDGATDYKVWVYAVADENAQALESGVITSEKEVETADMGNVSTEITLPEGWTSSNVSYYDKEVSAGAAIPSAKLQKDQSYIQTRVYEKDVVEVSFWMRGMATNTGTRLKIEGLINGEWTEIASVTPKVNESSTETISDIPEGVKQVKLTHIRKIGGNIALDDIVITTENNIKDELLTAYDGVLTGGASTLRVDKLKEGCTVYKYAVAATDTGKSFSKPSEYRYVNLKARNSVSTIDTNDTSLAIYVAGNTISVNTSAPTVEIFDTLGRRIATVKTINGIATATLEAKAMYIIRANGTTGKIVIR